MSDHDALLAAVIANPDDDTPRLVMADWFQENGDENRAEFIRVQCELSRLYPGWHGVPTSDSLAAGAPYDNLKIRERELLVVANGQWWRADLGDLAIRVRSRYDDLVFDRGFVGCVHITGSDWGRFGDELVCRVPLMRVTFDGSAPVIYDARWPVSLRDGGWGWEYLIAGNWVTVMDDEVSTEGPDVARFEHNCRAALSARWPTIPPEGWTFPSPETALGAAVSEVEMFRRILTGDWPTIPRVPFRMPMMGV